MLLISKDWSNIATPPGDKIWSNLHHPPKHTFIVWILIKPQNEVRTNICRFLMFFSQLASLLQFPFKSKWDIPGYIFLAFLAPFFTTLWKWMSQTSIKSWRLWPFGESFICTVFAARSPSMFQLITAENFRTLSLQKWQSCSICSRLKLTFWSKLDDRVFGNIKPLQYLQQQQTGTALDDHWGKNLTV